MGDAGTEIVARTASQYAALRARAIESLLIEKGLLTEEAVDVVVSAYENDVGPMSGARVVARSWVDPAFRERLLENATDAARELGIGGFVGEHVLAVENTDDVHNVVVCTLCSCYPRNLLGQPPAWYVSKAYRSRVVREPRVVLAEFGTELPADVTIRVHDSTAELRYLILPMRPEGARDWTEERLATLVTRDCMIGVAQAKSPDA